MRPVKICQLDRQSGSLGYGKAHAGMTNKMRTEESQAGRSPVSLEYPYTAPSDHLRHDWQKPSCFPTSTDGLVIACRSKLDRRDR